MKINLKSTAFEITNDISNYLHERLESIEKFLPEDGNSFMIDVELGKTTRHHNAGDIFRAEINIHIGKRAFRAVAEQTDLRSAIDVVKDEITRELSAHKEKRISLIRRGGAQLKNLIKKFYN